MAPANGKHSDEELDISERNLVHAVAEAVVVTKREGEQTRALLGSELQQVRGILDGMIEADARRWKAQHAHNSHMATAMTAVQADLDVMVRYVTKADREARQRDSLTEETAAAALAKAEKAEAAVGAVAWLRGLPRHPAVGFGVAVAALAAAILPILLKALTGR